MILPIQKISKVRKYLLLGSADHEGILSVIKTSHYAYRRKYLESGPTNWFTILDILESPSVEAVVAKLTSATYCNLLSSAYEGVADQLIAAIARKRNMVFAYEPLVDSNAPNDDHSFGEYYNGDFYLGYKHQIPPVEIREQVNRKFAEVGLQVIPYRTNAELTVIASQFIRELASKLLFRFYAPHGRLYATEMDKLLQLFKEYLDKTGRRGITMNRIDGEQGTSYEFCGEHTKGVTIAEDFQEFSDFMNFCVTDIDKARTMLALKDVDPNQIVRIVERYTKEARRLSLDLSHEREAKLLSVRHRLESELTDSVPQSVSQEQIRHLVDITIPASIDLVVPRTSLSAPQIKNLTMNINSQVVSKVNGIIARDISGQLNLCTEAQKLLDFVEEHGGPQAAEMVADLPQLIDEGIPQSVRLTKTQKLKSFLFGLAPDLGRCGIHLLEEYLKAKINQA